MVMVGKNRQKSKIRTTKSVFPPFIFPPMASRSCHSNSLWGNVNNNRYNTSSRQRRNDNPRFFFLLLPHCPTGARLEQPVLGVGLGYSRSRYLCSLFIMSGYQPAFVAQLRLPFDLSTSGCQMKKNELSGMMKGGKSLGGRELSLPCLQANVNIPS